MSTPEPLDEFAAGGVVEQRGGDTPSDYIPAFLSPGDHVLPASAHCGCPGISGCNCNEDAE